MDSLEFKRFFLDKVFNPVEQLDWKVEQIHMTSNELADIRKHFKDEFDVETKKEILKTGLFGYLYGATVHISKSNLPEHYTVVFGTNRDLKNVVCLRKNEVTREDCPYPECLVDAVHAL